MNSQIERKIEDAYPLSPMQEGVLFHCLFAPESGMYVTQLVCLLRNLDASAFEQAWRQAIDRHPILRTAFSWENLDRPVQVVGRTVGLPIEQKDWSALSSGEQQSRLSEFLLSDRRRKFELNKAPAFRLALLRIDNNSYRFVWTFHHMLLDGWSKSLLVKEVLSLYQSICSGCEPPPASSRPFREYIAWLESQDLSRAEVFWRRYLKGFSRCLQLDVDCGQASHAEQSRQESQSASISPAVTRELKSLARSSGLTMSTLVLAAWALLLSRYSGEEDVLFGATVSGRPVSLRGVETMLGLFINTVPVRTKIVPEDCLLTWIKRLQEELLDVREFECSPLVRVQSWSEAPKGAPLFETVVVFENYPVEDVFQMQPVDGQSLEIIAERTSETTNYPLTLTSKAGESISLEIGYDCARYEPTTAGRMLSHLVVLLEGIAANPRARLSSIRLLTQSERGRMLEDWNDTAKPYPRDKRIQDLFENQVRKSSDSIAVASEDACLSYAELNSRANRLARHLNRSGIGPESLVAISMRRGIDLAIAILGVIKGGGAFCLLDPSYPAERLAVMIASCAALVTDGFGVEPPACDRTPLVRIDEEWEAVAGEADHNFECGAHPENAAYLVFTSGSTGVPKGTIVSHRALTAYVSAITEQFDLVPADRILQMAAIGFDVVVEELFPAWCNGACVFIRDSRLPITLFELTELIARHQFTIFEMTTAYWHEWVYELFQTKTAIPSSLRALIIGGENVLPDRLDAWQRRAKVSLIHVYGLTETTVTSSVFKLVPGQSAPKELPVGRPVANTRIYLLDRNLEPVPVGVRGEIYIGGELVARGYVNRAEATGERFVPDIFGEEPGGRLYRTGDIARYLQDGNFVFVGRGDDQVKIRGHRVELGEIEAALSRHPSAREVAVAAREDSPGDKRIVAYFVPRFAGAMDAGDLREFLKQRLPLHMVPSDFVALGSLPVSANGKLDRQALPAPGTPATNGNLVEPRTSLEETLLEIWQSILGTKRLGICDNFFELGGHSLLAMRVLSRIRKVFKTDLPLRTAFDSPTIEAQTVEIVQKKASLADDEYLARTLSRLENMSDDHARFLLG